MKVVGFSPAQGQIKNIIVENGSGKFQTLSREQGWYVSDRWMAKATADYAFKNGFVQLPKPIEFDFFMRNIEQFES